MWTSKFTSSWMTQFYLFELLALIFQFLVKFYLTCFPYNYQKKKSQFGVKVLPGTLKGLK